MSTDVRIERVLPATISRVYDAWSRPELLTQWYCPNPAHDLKVEADVRVGGGYVVTMGPHVVRGNYLEVEPPRLLAFTWKWDGSEDEISEVRVELSEVDGGTHLLLSHTALSNAEDAAGHLQGWELQLTRLTDLISQQPAPATDPA
ncbi:SRPBCC domain-containing protein [Kribbella qitaiheensis]|uniref:SRPBCC domain-containing protein n=1 Tax=Kribbella qitaiheensis TaxID=1544730 RepID=A0A7G6WWX8_9ACTN|nr:SRPBCC domain-containing protein [Kribbella qitaiheensis]QNE18493.1 SRPBCC domain-containing protein [Kribbella qitaiheensis]